MHSLVSMLKFKRPQFSDTQKDFCISYIQPLMGKPDKDGNYILVVGNKPEIAFAAHHDTVHKDDGFQKLKVTGDVVRLANGSTSNCLGADCTTGVWLILEMIEAGIEGVYLIHSAEESGCVGSKALFDRNPRFLKHIKSVISFDRKGKEDIITHQMGYRTCSDDFAVSLDEILGLGMRPDPTGSYTDSNEYASKVSECTNISVGYLAQHTANESQDLQFAQDLRKALIEADWSKLRFSRDPSVVEYDYSGSWGYPLSRNYAAGYYGGWSDYSYNSASEEVATTISSDDEYEEILDICRSDPEGIASVMMDFGVSKFELLDMLWEVRYGTKYDTA